MEDLKYNSIGVNRPQGKRWFIQVTLPKELRRFNKNQPQYKLQCPKTVTTLSQANADTVTINKVRQQVMAWQSELDPLVASAEDLLEALYARFDEKGKKLDEEFWYKKRQVNREDLKSLRTYGEDDSPERKEYMRLLRILRMEVSKVFDGSEEHKDIPINALTNVEGIMREVSKSKSLVVTNKVSGEEKELDAEQRSLVLGILREDQEQLATGIDMRNLVEYATGEEQTDFSYFMNKHEGSMKSAFAVGMTSEQITDALGYYASCMRSAYGKQLELVEKKSNSFEDEHYQKTTGKAKVGIPFSKAMKSFWEQPDNNVTAHSTVQEYKRGQNFFIDHLGDLDVKEITLQRGLDYVNKLVEKKTGRFGGAVSNATIEKYVSGIRQVLNHSIDRNWIEADPWTNIGKRTKNRGKPKEEILAFEYDEIVAYFKQPIAEEEMMVSRILACTGYRLEEVTQLEYEDLIDLKQFSNANQKEETIKVFSFKNRADFTVKEKASVRFCPLHKTLMPYLDKWIANRFKDGTPTGRLFDYRIHHESQKSSDKASKLIGKWVEKVRKFPEQKLVTHSFRKSFTTFCATSGMEDSMRRYIGGWEQLGQDTNYLKYSADLAPVRDKLNEVNFDFIHGVADE